MQNPIFDKDTDISELIWTGYEREIMKKVLTGAFAVIVSVCMVLLVIQTKEKSEIKEKLNRADGIFQSSFSLLCSNLNEQETAETNEENRKLAYHCFSILQLTSFSESEAMNKVVHRLYDLSEKKALYTELNETGKEDLNKLCQNLHDENLLNKIVEEIY